MKNKVLSMAFIIVIGVLASFNVQFTKSSNDNYSLEVTNLKAFADNEINPWYKWLNYGYTADEREFVRPCPKESSYTVQVCIEYNSSGTCIKYEARQVNPSTRNEITCAAGSSNCTAVPC